MNEPFIAWVVLLIIIGVALKQKNADFYTSNEGDMLKYDYLQYHMLDHTVYFKNFFDHSTTCGAICSNWNCDTGDKEQWGNRSKYTEVHLPCVSTDDKCTKPKGLGYCNCTGDNYKTFPFSDAEDPRCFSGTLVMPSFLKVLGLLSPLFGIIGFVVAFLQTMKYVHAKEINIKTNKPTGGSTDNNRSQTFAALSMASTNTNTEDTEKKQDFQNTTEFQLRMVIVGMPLVFIVLSLRATIRIWAVMTGSCMISILKDWGSPDSSNATAWEGLRGAWESMKAAEVSTYKQDLEVASGFQFFAVWCYGYVVSKAFESIMKKELARVGSRDLEDHEQAVNDLKKDQTLLSHAGILGIWAFTGLGVLKTIINLACEAGEIAIPSANDAIENFDDIFLDKMNMMFALATVLSIINMLVVGKMQAVVKQLGGVNSKFNATRALLLLGQVQLMILLAASNKKNTLLEAIHKHCHTQFCQKINWTFTEYEAYLLNSSLLCIECFLIAWANFIVWDETNNPFGGIGEALLAQVDRIKNSCKKKADNRQPLLA